MKSVVRIGLIAVLALGGLTACGSNNCPNGAGVQIQTASFVPEKGGGGGGGGGGHSSGGSSGGGKSGGSTSSSGKNGSGSSGSTSGKNGTGSSGTGSKPGTGSSSSSGGISYGRPGWYPMWMPWFGGSGGVGSTQCRN